MFVLSTQSPDIERTKPILYGSVLVLLLVTFLLNLAGVLVRANDKLAANPNLGISDPYGEGWIAEIKPSAWDAEVGALITGAAGVAAYQAKLEADGVTCG